jgi:hypothetical protein
MRRPESIKPAERERGKENAFSLKYERRNMYKFGS